MFTRVITDMGGHFDEVRDGYEGELFLEVVPMSFTIKVKSGITLNQLRLMSGIARLSDDELLELSERDPIIYPGASSEPGDRAVVSDGLFLSVDLSGRSFVGYRARRAPRCSTSTSHHAYEVGDYWERVEPSSGKLILGAGDFYLLVSKERSGSRRLRRRDDGVRPDERRAADALRRLLRSRASASIRTAAPGHARSLEVRAHDVPFCSSTVSGCASSPSSGCWRSRTSSTARLRVRAISGRTSPWADSSVPSGWVFRAPDRGGR